jgi:nitrite reductase/ring-hydroxylating ferredoxin subunit
MTPDEFEKLKPEAQQAVIAEHDENVRIWRTICPHCKYAKHGTLTEIRTFFQTCNRLCKHVDAK